MLLLPAAITASEARDALRMLAQALKRESDAGVVIDASALQRFDSTAIALLLECRRLSQAWGKGFGIRNAPAKLVSLAKLYGVDALLSFEGVGAAAAA
jgi:phospholipid transport system transporter-binding protein